MKDNYDKQFEQARERIFAHIDRGCKSEVQELIDIHKQTGMFYLKS